MRDSNCISGFVNQAFLKTVKSEPAALERGQRNPGPSLRLLENGVWVMFFSIITLAEEEKEGIQKARVPGGGIPPEPEK